MALSPILLLVHDSTEERDAAVEALQPGDTMAIIGYMGLRTLDDVSDAFADAHQDVEIEYAFSHPYEGSEYCLIVRKLTYAERAQLRVDAAEEPGWRLQHLAPEAAR